MEMTYVIELTQQDECVIHDNDTNAIIMTMTFCLWISSFFIQKYYSSSPDNTESFAPTSFVCERTINPIILDLPSHHAPSFPSCTFLPIMHLPSSHHAPSSFPSCTFLLPVILHATFDNLSIDGL